MSDASETLVRGEPPALLSPGLQLQAARERAGWTEERLAAELCLPVDRLRALERDEHAAFGGVVFVRGYLRRAATLLGMSPNALVAAFEACCDTTRPAEVLPAPLPGRPPRRGPPGWLAPAGGLVAAAGVVAVTWWLLPVLQHGMAPTANGPSPTAPAALEFKLAEEPPTATPGVAALEPASVEATGESVGELADGSAADAGAGPAPSEAVTALAAVEYVEPVVPVPGTVELRFEFTEDCWLEVHDADGRRLAYRLHRAGDVSRLRGKAPVEVFLGNANGARLSVDGAPLALRPAASREGTARLTVGGGAG